MTVMKTSPLAVAVVLDVSLVMPMLDLMSTAVREVNRLADALDRSDRHVFAGCVTFAAEARVVSRDELSDLDWDFEYMTAITTGIELATDMLDDHARRRLVLITPLSFRLARFPEPIRFPDAPEEQLTAWAERARAWADDREADEFGRVGDALTAAVRRGRVVDIIMCRSGQDEPPARHLERLGELVTASGGVVRLLTRDDTSAIASLREAVGLPA